MKMGMKQRKRTTEKNTVTSVVSLEICPFDSLPNWFCFSFYMCQRLGALVGSPTSKRGLTLMLYGAKRAFDSSRRRLEASKPGCLLNERGL